MKRALFFLILTFTTNAIGIYYQWYLTYSWFDQILHFSGGFFIAMFFSIYLKDHLLENSKLKNTLIILSVASFIGVTWEFTEYIANLLVSPAIYEHYGVRTYFMGDLNDTMNDLLMDILGATLFANIFLSRTKLFR